MLKGEGDTNSFWVVLTWDLEVLAILTGGEGVGRKTFPPFKRGRGGGT